MKIRRALVSTSDKSGIAEFCRELDRLGVDILSTGGTASLLRENDIAVTDVSDVTGFPEIMNGRVKTLHPLIHGGILARRDDESHVSQMTTHGIRGIDLVVVNLYPFESVSQSGASFEKCVENIDVGGPTMIRAAAKNWEHVVVLVDPSDYSEILEACRSQEDIGAPLRKRLASKAFARTADYDRAISSWWSESAFGNGVAREVSPNEFGDSSQVLSPWNGTMKELRYGENPHQKAFALIAPDTATMGAGHAEQLWGKELSYNNLLDVDAAFELVRDLSRPAAAVIKHTNPCGAALGRSSADAFSRAYEADSRSAFGGIVAFNSPVDKETAEQIADKKKFLEVLIAPSFEEDALEVLKQGPKWCRNLRILRTGPRLEKGPSTRLQVRSLRGVLLCQEYDDVEDSLEEVVTQRVPDSKERVSLDLAWRIVRHVKSNAIVLVKDGVLVGSGAGQMSRVESVTLAIQRAGVNSEGASMGSDAFFPFPDGIETAARAGVRSVVQPGGSVKDGAVIEAADTADMSMIFTRRRHFRH